MLTLPKRLFHVPSMRVRLYDDVVDDVQQKGYVAVSHVWGDQQMFTALELGIHGVDWDIPLSNSNKIHRLVDAMKHREMEYCWWDVLCMPQDRQDEINLEIPYMGDYYTGASTTLVLSTVDYNITADFGVWHTFMVESMLLGRDLTKSEHQWILGIKNPILDLSKESWFKRVWTFQEAVLSKNLILVLVNGLHVNLSTIFEFVYHLCVPNTFYARYLFSDFGRDIMAMSTMSANAGNLEMVVVLGAIASRDCHKIHDRFYGVLGVLGYKDFIASYDMDIDELNKTMAKYAYSKGDISWMSVFGNVNKGFAQPMYTAFSRTGVDWKEEELGACNIKLQEDTLCMDVTEYATIVRCENSIKSNVKQEEIFRWTASVLRRWNFGREDIINNITHFHKITRRVARAIKSSFGDFREDHIVTPKEAFTSYMEELIKDVDVRGMDVEEVLSSGFLSMHSDYGELDRLTQTGLYKNATIVEAVSNMGEHFAVTVFGDAAIGDKIVLAKIHDSEDRTLGFVLSNLGERKGTLAYKKVDVSEYLYVSHTFLL